MADSVRLNKFISESGMCSRREADKFIENGNVTINDKKAKLGDLVFPKDKVRLNGHLIQSKIVEDQIFIALNKPVGITSTTETSVRDNIVSFVNHSARIFPIGRLDKESQGLILLTNNGDIVNKILRAANNHEKEYLVTVNKPMTDDFIESMANGVPILGVMTKKCVVKKETPFIFRIILVQGLNQQIRRMCEYFGYEVTKLERIRIMNISLKGLPLGEWRDILPEEMEVIMKLVGKSSSESKKSDKSNNRDNNKNNDKIGKTTKTETIDISEKRVAKKPSLRKSSSQKTAQKPKSNTNSNGRRSENGKRNENKARNSKTEGKGNSTRNNKATKSRTNSKRRG